MVTDTTSIGTRGEVTRRNPVYLQRRDTLSAVRRLILQRLEARLREEGLLPERRPDVRRVTARPELRA